MCETYDLIYCEDRAEYQEYQRLLSEAFPDCTFEDGSDLVHPHRFVIKRDVAVDDAYYETLIRLGITASLNLQLKLMEGQGRIGRILDKLEAESEAIDDEA